MFDGDDAREQDEREAEDCENENEYAAQLSSRSNYSQQPSAQVEQDNHEEDLSDHEHAGDQLDEDDVLSLGGGGPAESGDELEEDQDSNLSLSGTNDLTRALAMEREQLAAMEAQIEEEERKALESDDEESFAQITAGLTQDIVQRGINRALGIDQDEEIEALDTDERDTSAHPEDAEEEQEPDVDGQEEQQPEHITKSKGNSEVELIYDPLLECYYSPSEGKYYQLKS
jgi:hypothetical protein